MLWKMDRQHNKKGGRQGGLHRTGARAFRLYLYYLSSIRIDGPLSVCDIIIPSSDRQSRHNNFGVFAPDTLFKT